MPLAVGTATPTLVASTWSPPPPFQVGTMRAVWLDPLGQRFELSGPHELHGWLTTRDIAGWGAGPRTYVTDPQATGGVSVRFIRTEPRRITWPLHVYGDTHEEFLGRWRRLMSAFLLTAQVGRPGILRIARPSGEEREIEAFYEEGFEGNAGENWVSANPVLTLFCPDGFWRAPEPVEVPWGYRAEPGGPFLHPFITVSSGRSLGSAEVLNPGDVDAWPVWEIAGPASLITITNNTLGLSFGITYPLGAGGVVTVDTTPSRPRVRGPAGQNLFGALNWPAVELWPLARGLNDLTISISGAGDTTGVRMTYRPRFEAA
ncbi:hypothetical protein E1091_01110 [Micromonospora fluostatini]|uniref:Phage tail family protein n=1 Tax=Micromonospora fluostatini TaxID=1629071 RepID=A0ABY2DLQ8_9ACTN|nr:hypothetical protein E1091_01110 [Micromonospora fluostatini]